MNLVLRSFQMHPKNSACRYGEKMIYSGSEKRLPVLSSMLLRS
jgi:hypothetical protein